MQSRGLVRGVRVSILYVSPPLGIFVIVPLSRGSKPTGTLELVSPEIGVEMNGAGGTRQEDGE